MLIASPLTLFMKKGVIDELPDLIDKDIFEKINLVGSTLQMSFLLPKEDRRKVLFDAGMFTKLLLENNFDGIRAFELSELSLESQTKLEEIENAISVGEKIGERIIIEKPDGDRIVEIFDPVKLEGV